MAEKARTPMSGAEREAKYAAKMKEKEKFKRSGEQANNCEDCRGLCKNWRRCMPWNPVHPCEQD